MDSKTVSKWVLLPVLWGIKWLLAVVFQACRVMLKVVVRRLTRTAELDRVCACDLSSEMVTACEYSLASSNSLSARWIALRSGELSPSELEATIMSVCHSKALVYIGNASTCMRITHAIAGASRKLRNLKGTDYSVALHRPLLDVVWRQLVLESHPSGDDWTHLGFQQANPASDFRGMGLLGLLNLAYFACVHPDKGGKVLSASLHPKYEFPFAITGIQITAFLMKLFDEAESEHFPDSSFDHWFRLKPTAFRGLLVHFLLRNQKSAYKPQHISRNGVGSVSSLLQELCQHDDELIHRIVILFCEVYCGLMDKFSRFWQNKEPPDIMAFPPLFKAFSSNVRASFESPDTWSEAILDSERYIQQYVIH